MNKVYVNVDNLGVIKRIDSDLVLQDTVGWTQIDEGKGDRYTHAQGNYLPRPLMDDQGRYRYKLTDGAVVERTLEELEADVIPTPAPTQAEINAANIDFLAMMTGVEL